MRQRNYGFERRRKADAKRAKQLAKQERKRGEGDPPGPDMGEVQDAGAPVGMWEWFSPSRSRVVTTDTGARPAADGDDDWVLLTDAEAETPPAADGGEDPARSGA